MKKILALSFVPVMVAMLVISSCDKKKDPTPTTEQLLTRATGWKMTAVTSNGIDVTANIDSWEKDNIYKFTQTGTTSGGAYTIDEGATKENPDDPQTSDSGTWALSSDKKTITVSSATDDPFQATITTLNATTFTISQTETISGITFTYTQTFIGL